MFKIRKRHSTVNANFAEGMVIYDLKRRIPFLLNPVARDIWQRINRFTTKKSLADYMVKKYAVGKKQAGRDLNLLIKALRKKGLVEDAKT